MIIKKKDEKKEKYYDYDIKKEEQQKGKQYNYYN